MDVRLLVVDDCPNEAPAAAALRQALDDVGLTDTEFTTQVVASPAQAAQLGFLGSPTVLIDGRDPFADQTGTPGLSCRLYRDGNDLTGVPPAGRLRQAIQQAADARTSE
jgi:hypothetical protein